MEFPCSSCGAELHWKPGEGALVCPHCGAEVAAPEAAAQPIVEHALGEAALAAPSGYGTETTTLACAACGAVHDVSGHVEATQCPFCGASQVAPEPDALSIVRPESVLPFAIERDEAVRRFRQWLGSLWLRPSSLTSAAQLQSIRGVYIPAWTFDADARSSWSAEAGHHERVERPVTVQRDGREVTETRMVTETRWEPASGRHQAHYDDWVVQASGGLDQAALKGLLPFELEALRPYAPAFLAGFQAERYRVDLDEAWAVAQQELRALERSECRDEVPGDTQRNLEVQTRFDDVHFKHLLLPVWIAAYRYEGQVYRYLVNGQSGRATGDAPYSKLKIALVAVLFALAILGCMGLLSMMGVAGVAAGS